MFLLMFSTLLDYFTGLKMQSAENQKWKRFWFWLSVIINLGFLAVFKYYNFLLNLFRCHFSFGIKSQSEYTKYYSSGRYFILHLSWTFVCNRYLQGQNQSRKSFVDYAVFVSFFPLLVAGPIERATHLLPQIKRKNF